MNILDAIFGAVFGKGGGLTYRELRKSTERVKFSDYLPWISYDEKSEMYLLSDDNVGFAWECTPLCFASDDTIKTLEGLFRMALPQKSVIQFILFSDKNIDPILQRHIETRSRKCDLTQKAAEHFVKHFSSGKDGFDRMQGIPLRDFRLFITLKIPIDELDNTNINEVHSNATEILKGSRLCPFPLTAMTLMDWARRLLNDTPSANNWHYDYYRPLRKQVIMAETETVREPSRLRFGKKWFRCTTPKSMPQTVDLYQTNQLIGGVFGLINDADQIKTSFIWSVNIIFEKVKAKLHAKCNIVLQQKGGLSSFASTLARKQDEYKWAVDKVERGEVFVRVVPTFWVFDESERKVNESISRVRRIHEDQGYVMQDDRWILPILFTSSLPFGFYVKEDNLDKLDRDFIAPVEAACRILPIQADYSGRGKPVLLFVGRKGQIIPLDIFDKGSNNHNMFIAAGSGAGKSFLVNYLSSNYYGSGAKIRIVDIGGSYKKMTHAFNAKYLDFAPDSNICLNPLSVIKDPEYDIPMAARVVAQMAYSATPTANVTPTEMTIVETAVTWAIEKYGPDANIDSVYEALGDYENLIDTSDIYASDDIPEIAKTIAFNIYKFTTKGIYGRFFNGKSTLNISADHFVVLELENLAQIPALFNVVTLQIVNLVTQDLYMGDKSTPTMIIFDEAHQFLRKSGLIKDAIETGYRRARKYNGSFSIITQSLLDLKKFGDVGEVIWGNSAYRFLLESVDFPKAKEEKLISYDDFTMRIMNSTKSVKPNYSEIFMDTPAGQGVGRLLVGPWTYWLYTSAADEVAKVEKLVAGGMTYVEAIDEMVRRCAEQKGSQEDDEKKDDKKPVALLAGVSKSGN